METNKRLKIALIGGVFLMCLASLAVFKGMEGLASACVAGILTVLSTYVYSETIRPSDPKV